MALVGFLFLIYGLDIIKIRLKAGEEYKTAFQTHSGHFEFRVMAFGLCGGPGTFQGAMNTVLAPLLRKCVIVFFDDILVYSSTFEEHVVHLQQVLSLLAEGLLNCLNVTLLKGRFPTLVM